MFATAGSGGVSPGRAGTSNERWAEMPLNPLRTTDISRFSATPSHRSVRCAATDSTERRAVGRSALRVHTTGLVAHGASV